MADTWILNTGKGDVLTALRSFLEDIMNKQLVDAVMVPVRVSSGGTVVQTLITDPARLENAVPMSPVVMVNSARIVSDITKVDPSKKKLAVVLKSCEIRALLELVKLKQADLSNILIIGVDCPGTYEPAEFKGRDQEVGSIVNELISNASDVGEDIRTACRICEYPVPDNCDITVGLIGVDTGKEVLIQANTDEGRKVVNSLSLPEAGDLESRDKVVEKLVDDRTEYRDRVMSEMAEKISGMDNLLSVFELCIKCHNCMTVCPICYCRQCFFDSPTFEHSSDKYLALSEKKGAVKMPSDTVLYHLTRMSHMMTSCVGCGLCESACPASIPLSSIYKTVSIPAQKAFDYIAGRSLDEPLPLSTFRENELEEVFEE